MPGLVGEFHRRPDIDIRSSLSKAELNGASEAKLESSSTAFLGVSMRPKPSSTLTTHQEEGFICALYGHCLDPQSNRQLNAASLVSLLRSEGEKVWDRLEGGFHFLQHFQEQNRLILVNDRLALLPLYWFADQNHFCFGPKLRFLSPMAQAGELDPTSVLHFLSIGKYPGTRTQVKNISMLGPAVILDIDLNNLNIKSKHYWNLKYASEKGTDTNKLCRDLGEAIHQAVDLFTLPESGKHGIFLSGGWDSRSILGACQNLKKLPVLAITNGKNDTLVHSDTWLAKRMAEDIGIGYRFCQRVPDAGASKWKNGIRFGEIPTENNPENFGNHMLPSDLFDGIDFILKGDVTWGSGELALNEEMSISKNFPFPLKDNLKQLISAELRPQADELYSNEINNMMEGCEDTEWADRQQWLWQMSGINRYIMGLGISDEEHIEVRRPLLSKIVLDAYMQVPRKLRVNKNLFIQSIKMFHPELFAYGRNHTSHIANYYVHMANHIRTTVNNHLNVGHDLEGILDIESCRDLINGFDPQQVNEELPNLKSRLYNKIHDRYSYLWTRSRFYKEDPVASLGTGSQSLVFRLYLLLEWHYSARS